MHIDLYDARTSLKAKLLRRQEVSPDDPHIRTGKYIFFNWLHIIFYAFHFDNLYLFKIIMLF